MTRPTTRHDHDPAAAMVTVYSCVPERALTAELLGTVRSGNGVRIRPDGLIVTVGYLVLEAEQVWVTTPDGGTSPAYVVAEDYESGLSLLRTTMALGEDYLQPGPSEPLQPGDAVQICSRAGCSDEIHTIAAKQEFAGRWEYLLDEALFVTPACSDWAGIGLLDQAGRLCGLGSLMLEIPGQGESGTLANMYIPVDLIAPYLDEMCEHGRRLVPPRPWLGSLIQEYDGKLVVVGIYKDCPAHRAGIEPGDIVVSVNDEPVTSLSEMLRKVWSLGSAGVEVPLTVTGSGSVRKCLLQSIDRSCFRMQQPGENLN